MWDTIRKMKNVISQNYFVLVLISITICGLIFGTYELKREIEYDLIKQLEKIQNQKYIVYKSWDKET